MSKKTSLPIIELAAGCCSPVTAEPLAEAQAGDLAVRFRALADPVRLRLFSLIAARGGDEACVCDLTETFELSGPTMSYHLKTLREAGLVSSERRGTWVYYRLVPQVLEQLAAVLTPSLTPTPAPTPAPAPTPLPAPALAGRPA
ncbi:MAG TPA: metalloregulator ArsR/SmtB family transcription factor [Actinomycetes bacterium]|nr:metalloregulator ArsR/SmtB family transcription factor [Actinomycetes bacterium]